MDNIGKNVLLIDLPTFPRGVLSLSLPTVAACLRADARVRIVDLNFHGEEDYRRALRAGGSADMVGMKVSAQNLERARAVSALCRELFPGSRIVWGGEAPTLLPEECLKDADSIVRGRFEPHAKEMLGALAGCEFKRIYESDSPAAFNGAPPPALDLIAGPEKYLQFMGLPLETSLGCMESCTFCMVRTMQKKVDLRAADSLRKDLDAARRAFINVVDYNIGNSKEHLITVARALGATDTYGWMCETCVENLEDDDVLDALAASRCRMVYCGLESLSPMSLKYVNKPQNDVESYRRIIRKAQSRGVEVASGFILGLGETTHASFREFGDFADEIGLIYLKLTFLTFNPGDKVNASMSKKGRYLSERFSDFDGNHLTFLPEGLRPEVVFDGARDLIERFYSLGSLWRRSAHLSGRPARRAEFMLFSYCYGQAYRDWLAFDVLRLSGGRFEDMMRRPMKKTVGLRLAESALSRLRSFAG